MDLPLNASTVILLTSLTPYLQVKNKPYKKNNPIDINQFWYFSSV